MVMTPIGPSEGPLLRGRRAAAMVGNGTELRDEFVPLPHNRRRARRSRRAAVSEGPVFVGQAIEVRVGAIAEVGEARVSAPRVAGAEIAPSGSAWEPIATNGIGEVIRETRRYVFRFRLVAERSGPLTVPPFRVEVGERSGKTGTIRLNVRDVPVVGRPASFLGGVGAVKAAASANPGAVRVGQEIAYEIRLEGPGARGSTRRPTLSARRLRGTRDPRRAPARDRGRRSPRASLPISAAAGQGGACDPAAGVHRDLRPEIRALPDPPRPGRPDPGGSRADLRPLAAGIRGNDSAPGEGLDGRPPHPRGDRGGSRDGPARDRHPVACVGGTTPRGRPCASPRASRTARSRPSWRGGSATA